MTTPLLQSAAPPPRNLLRLLVATLLVCLAHALLLGGLPADRVPWPAAAASGPQQPLVWRFTTRTLPEQAPQPSPAATASPAANAPRKPAVLAQSVAPDTSIAATHSTAPAAPPEAAEPAVPSAAAASPAPTPASASAAEAAMPQSLARAVASNEADKRPPRVSPQAEPPAPQAPADVPAAGATKLPPALRLLYDGSGMERGFIKYSGSGEVLWEPSDNQYQARLEITTWGVRVRTWTSKGKLSAGGLEPLRFGDRPRGPELATHFQRDKNIISFSANNPDVPLQAGAQDKLSALLQLGAMVAGAPAQYAEGSTISFQAADAHRAEPWSFRVGKLEALELPGGARQGLKLHKAPTLEYDQGIEVWLAPDLYYLPVRLRITEANGDYVDLVWRKTQKPDGS